MRGAARLQRRGLTLVECAAVVALLALAVSVVAVGMSPGAAGRRLQQATSSLLDLDARARELGIRGQPTAIRATKDGAAVVAEGSDAPLVERPLHHDIELRWLDAASETPLAEIRVDARGRSIDYRIELRLGAHRAEWLVAGLTGYAAEAGGAER